MSPMKLEINDEIIKKQLLINDEAVEKKELETLFPSENIISSAVIKPVPGFCVKTKNTATQDKVFVNVCTSDSVPAPEDISNEELLQILESEEPSEFRIPMSIGAPREEKDKSGKACHAYDIVINPKFLEKLKDNPLFENFFMIVTIESLEEKYSVPLDKNSWVTLKNKKYQGSMADQRVRTELPLIQELSGVKKWTPKDFPTESTSETSTGDEPHAQPLIKEIKTTKLTTDDGKRRPRFNLIRSNVKYGVLKAEIPLPGVISAEKIEVHVGEDHVTVETDEYFMDQILPYSLDGSLTKAYFVKDIMVLVLLLAQTK